MEQILVTEIDLARLCGLSARRIRQLATEGIIRKTGNKYDLAETFPKLLEHYRQGEGELKDPLKRAQLRKLEADAELKELELCKAKGEVGLVSEFVAVQTYAMTVLRTNLMQVPTRAVIQIVGSTDETYIKEILKREITDALSRTAETDMSQAFDDNDEENELEEDEE